MWEPNIHVRDSGDGGVSPAAQALHTILTNTLSALKLWATCTWIQKTMSVMRSQIRQCENSRSSSSATQRNSLSHPLVPISTLRCGIKFYFRSRMCPVIVVAVGYREWLGHRDKIIQLLIRKILTQAKMAPCRVRSWQHWSWHSWRMVVHVMYPYTFFDSTEKADDTVLE